jgi:hypothetical protein
VPNPGFETQVSCPAVSEITKAAPWNSPSVGTPDLFNSTCSTQNTPGHTGIGSSGIYCYSVFPNSREYLQARLLHSLVAGQTYQVSFYVQRTNFKYSVSTIGAYFSVDSVYLFQTDNLPYTPNVVSPSGTQLSSTSWTQISGSFIASGGEKFILLGNFNGDANTTKAIANAASPDSVAYYHIDDISVTGPTGIAEISSDMAAVYPSPATDIVNIEMANGIEIRDIELFDILSNKLNVQPQFENGNTKATLNTQNLPAGYYVMSVNTNLGMMSKKILISK